MPRRDWRMRIQDILDAARSLNLCRGAISLLLLCRSTWVQDETSKGDR